MSRRVCIDCALMVDENLKLLFCSVHVLHMFFGGPHNTCKQDGLDVLQDARVVVPYSQLCGKVGVIGSQRFVEVHDADLFKNE